MRHNKKRNSALLYEFLIRHISKCLVEGRKEEARKAVNISKKYFSDGTPLRGELNLFSTVLKNTVKSKSSAQRVLGTICNNAAYMNARVLDEQKSRLIKEINYTFKSPEIYDYKIPNYTIYASLQTLLNEARNKKKSMDVVHKVRLEESVVDYLTRNAEGGEDPLKTNPSYNNAVYKFLLQRFHQKYEGKLNESQKKLLLQYTTSLISNDTKPLKKYLLSESTRIRSRLSNVKDPSLREDKDLMAKISECVNKFSSIDLSKVEEKNILEILQYQKLLEEVES